MLFNRSRLRIFSCLAALIAGTSLFVSACSSSGSGTSGSASNLLVSGGFNSLTLFNHHEQSGGNLNTFATTDYTVICAIMVDPFTTGKSTVSADGTFSLTISGGSGQPIGCMMVKSGALVASFEFSSGSTGMTGATGGESLSVNSGTTEIKLPTNLSVSGAKVSVPTTSVTQNSSTAPTVSWTDLTGTWNIAGACMTTTGSDGVPTKNCVAPGSIPDMPASVYIKQFTATNGSETKTGLSLWRSEAARTGCGSKEGITLSGGWTANGGWDGSMTGGLSMNLTDDSHLHAFSAKAKVRVHGGSATCGKSTLAGGGPIVDGTTTCNAVDWTGGGWGLSASACELYCVVNALSSGGDQNSDFDWTGATCKKRYRVNWEVSRELAIDKNFGSGTPAAGAFSSGHCSDASFDGCKDSGSGQVLFKFEKAQDQFMIGELFITGNVGSIMEQEHFSASFDNGSHNGVISCGGTHINKMTITQTSTTTATAQVENKFVADASNAAGCATNSDFNNNFSHDSSIALKLTK